MRQFFFFLHCNQTRFQNNLIHFASACSNNCTHPTPPNPQVMNFYFEKKIKKKFMIQSLSTATLQVCESLL